MLARALYYLIIKTIDFIAMSIFTLIDVDYDFKLYFNVYIYKNKLFKNI